jgi:hypothetical protein
MDDSVDAVELLNRTGMKECVITLVCMLDIFHHLVVDKNEDIVSEVDFAFIVRAMKPPLFGPLFGINPGTEISPVI